MDPVQSVEVQASELTGIWHRGGSVAGVGIGPRLSVAAMRGRPLRRETVKDGWVDHKQEWFAPGGLQLGLSGVEARYLSLL